MDPSQSCSVQLEGGTIMFMPPELLIPSIFGVKNPVPTPEADIYAFSLVIFQVREEHGGYLLLAYTAQVLIGEIPFRGVRPTELGFSLVQGLRPDKPANALAIGFSDSLWTFVQRCWDGDRHSRPKVAEVVTHLAEAAASWRGLMPACGETENIASVPEESISRTMQHGKFKTSFSWPLPIKRTTIQVQYLRGPRVSLWRVPPIRKLAFWFHHPHYPLNHCGKNPKTSLINTLWNCK